MTSLKPNLVKRVERLPKPTNSAGALQPLFEAISNAIHSTQGLYGESVDRNGQVIVEVQTNRKKEDVWASVEDNGFGLDEDNWDAFTTTDTDNKITIGGKGVGRLLWLDCFEKISVSSVFNDGDAMKRRKFDFKLAKDDQIQNLDTSPIEASNSGFFVKFEGLRDNEYLTKFPGRNQIVFQHLTSHFLPTFIGGRSPHVTVTVGDETREFPSAIEDIVKRQEPEKVISTEIYGDLKLTMMECDKVASSDLKGSHFIHFIAHDRTVHSQCIDARLGLKYFGEGGDRVFHAILKGKFLDKNVNQERTAFVFEDAIIERIVKDVCAEHYEQFLEAELSKLKGAQRVKIEAITQSYPSVAFGDTSELQDKIPSGELVDDAIYGHLARERFRRDQRQAEKIRSVLKRLKDGTADADQFAEAIAEAGNALEDAEQKSLAEYIVRRKVVLDFLELLLQKVRNDDKDSSYQREDVLHSFICPLRVNAANANSKVETATSHDLWIIDERLTFAQYFSSDVPFDDLAEAFESKERPDVLIFDYVHGLRQTENPGKVLLVEFKRPGRDEYKDDENPLHQVERYVRKLKTGSMTDVKGRPIKLGEDTVFYCFVVADIVGKMDDWTFSWQRTADGRGRLYQPREGFKGSIELIGWDELLSDAKARNEAFFDKAGISGKSFFSID